ncbi:MAG: hypothetical protein LZF62_230016 [Nitrospira sp.]|nr:MAG: hypothetical protein LZF62_230016 [Nitrospira sp.]
MPRACHQSFFVQWLLSLIGQCRETQAREGSVSTTDDQPALISAGRFSPAA